MITFLRKIRRSLIVSGSTQKYLLYAIGEIALVVIGILIALQINNWNEAGKLKIIEIEYLSALNDELRYNLEEINEVTRINQANLNGLAEMLKHVGPSNSELDETSFNKLLDSLSEYRVSYDPSLGVIQDLISSGNLNRISNPILRRKLASWESKLAKLKSREERVQSFRTRQFNLMIDHISFLNMLKQTNEALVGEIDIGPSQFNIKNRKLLMDPKFENILTFRYTSSKTLGIEYSEFQSFTDGIVKLIEMELKK